MLEVKNIHKKFGSNEVLKGVDFKVEKGSVIAVLGNSGSGKTTLLRCFNRLVETGAGNRVTGRVLVDGETGRDEYNLSSRTNGGRLVHLKGESSLIGKFIDVKITASNTWALYGEIV